MLPLIPFLPPNLVRRPRLVRHLSRGWEDGHRLFVVAAPAGYGKTTLVLDWLSQTGHDHAWAGLDGQDNDPSRFFSRVVRALEGAYPGLEQVLLPLLNQPQLPSLEKLIAEILRYEAGRQAPFCLVLDDYHAIRSPEVHSLLQRLFDNLPPSLRLVVISRQDPPLPLARLRARGQLTEIRHQDLRFAAQETGQFLEQLLERPLNDRQLSILAERTEGWVAGLQLAGLSLRSRPDVDLFLDEFRGAHRYVIDYLAEEVLAQLEPEMRNFLIRSAQLERFDPGLLDFALQRQDSAALLRTAEAANLFLIPLDEQRRWYRYHHLLADILRGELSQTERAEIQTRAAQWMASQGDLEQAIYYALLAGAEVLAGKLVQQAALPTAESGQVTRVMGWLDALPETVLLAEPDLAVFKAWFLVLSAQITTALAWMGRLDQELSAALSPTMHGMLICLRAWSRMAAGEGFDLEAILEGQRKMGEDGAYFRPLILLAAGQAYLSVGQTQTALDVYEEGQRLAEAANQPVTALILGNNRAFLLESLGQHDQAVAVCQEGIEVNTNPDGELGLLAGIPCVCLGCLYFGSGEDDLAYLRLTQGLNLIERMGLYDVLASPAVYCLALLLAGRGKPEEAARLARENQRRAVRLGLKAVVRNTELIEAELALRQGNLSAAGRWLRKQAIPDPLPEQGLNHTILLLAARVHLAKQDYARVSSILAFLEEKARRKGAIPDLVGVLITQARLGQAQGDLEGRSHFLREAVDLAAAHHCVRAFYPLEDLREPLETFRGRAPGLVQTLLGDPEHPARPGLEGIIDPPSLRELEILRLAAAGLSNQGISDRLYISVGTIKWHLNHLYAKLGASSRTQATVKAREMGLL